MNINIQIEEYQAHELLSKLFKEQLIGVYGEEVTVSVKINVPPQARIDMSNKVALIKFLRECVSKAAVRTEYPDGHPEGVPTPYIGLADAKKFTEQYFGW